MPPPTARQKAGETDIFKLDGTDICTLGLQENVRAADIVLTADDLLEVDRIVPPGAASGTRYPIGQMHRPNV
jgi:hypothetical protein